MNATSKRPRLARPPSDRPVLPVAFLAALGLSLLVLSSCASVPQGRLEKGYVRKAYVELNGFTFFMDIRGGDASLPILLVLHGGPGWPVDTLFHRILPELEKHFLVVNWHQRGAGRSYRPGIPERQMDLDVFLDDTKAVVHYLLGEYRQERLFLLGHSWGTVIGSLVAADEPESIYAYIGISQLTNTLQMLVESKRIAAKVACDQGMAYLARDLEALHPEEMEKDWYKDAIRYRDILTRIKGTVYGTRSYYFFVRHYLADASYGWPDKLRIISGLDFSIYQLYPDMLRVNLNQGASRIDAPVFLIQGAYDLLTIPELTGVYFSGLQSPRKKFYLFPDSAHSPQFEEPGRFVRLMVEDVLPLAYDKRVAAVTAPR